MIAVAGHDQERNAAAGSGRDLLQVLHQTLHDVDRPGDPDVIHAFGIITPQPGAHAAGQQDTGHLPGADGFQPFAGKLFPFRRDLFQRKALQGFNGLPGTGRAFAADAVQDGQVRRLDLVQQLFPALLCQSFIIVQDMGLSIPFQFLKRFCIIHQYFLRLRGAFRFFVL